MATQAADIDPDPAVSVDLLRAARAGARGRLTATEQAVLAGRLAAAHATAGQHREARTAVDDALFHIERSKPAEDPPYIYWASFHAIAYYAGTATLVSGDHQAAISYLTRSVDEVTADFPRDRAVYRARLSTAYARAGQTDMAVDLAHTTIDEAATVPSVANRTLLVELWRDIRATGHPGTPDLIDHARTALGVTSL